MFFLKIIFIVFWLVFLFLMDKDFLNFIKEATLDYKKWKKQELILSFAIAFLYGIGNVIVLNELVKCIKLYFLKII